MAIMLCATLLATALLLPAPPRAPPASMLLGADGLPMKKGQDAPAPPSAPSTQPTGYVAVDVAMPTEKVRRLAPNARPAPPA